MTRRQFLFSSSAAAYQKDQPVQRPNILVILADDLAAWMLGCYGNKEIKTPNIDNVARGGLRFANALLRFADLLAQPSDILHGPCTAPARHPGFSDRQARSRIRRKARRSRPPRCESEVMISDLLSKAGYSCGYVGKWHMGEDAQPGHGYKYTLHDDRRPRSYTDPEM